MKEYEVLQCQIQEWYPRYKSVSMATEIHRVSDPFISYVLDDGFFLPASSEALPKRHTPEFPELQAVDYHHWEEEEEDIEEGAEEQAIRCFPELESAVQASIDRLGGAVLPKLNWSAPKDAVWISSSKNLKCKNFGDIALLLKASDSIVHDLCHGFDNCEDKSRERPEEVVLALRKWYDLRPEMEFRAFVRGGILLGVCQREVTGFYPSLLEAREAAEAAIVEFFRERISGTFGLDYTFDVYLTKDRRVKLLDFNPWGGSTLPLLFSWEELEEMFEKRAGDAGGEDLRRVEEDENAAGGVELRLIESQGLVRPNLTGTSGVPLDYIDNGPGSAWDVFFKNAEEQMKQE